MTKNIQGLIYERTGDSAICHIELLSDDIKELIRKNLTTICHGSHASGKALFSYNSTLISFFERYDSKSNTTKIGLIGELLSHVLFTELFDEFVVASPFFNLEEKSMKKGFDLLLYRSSDTSIWISEVKSGNLHKNKNHDETARDLLNTARADLVNRLNAQETMFWLNALHSVQCAVNGKADYKSVLEEILSDYGSAAAEKKASSKDKCVILVSNLFEPLNTRVAKNTATDFFNKTIKANYFSKIFIFCVQKATIERVVDFLKSEMTK